MHLRYWPTVTSQFTIKIRFCFLLSLFPTNFPCLAWVLTWENCVHADQGHPEGVESGQPGPDALCSPRRGSKKGLCCQQYEMIFVLQINHSLTSARPIVHLLSSVALVVVNRRLWMFLSWYGGVYSSTGRRVRWLAQLCTKETNSAGMQAVDLYLVIPHA